MKLEIGKLYLWGFKIDANFNSVIKITNTKPIRMMFVNDPYRKSVHFDHDEEEIHEISLWSLKDSYVVRQITPLEIIKIKNEIQGR